MAVGYAVGSGHLLLAFTSTRQACLLGRYHLSSWELLFLALEITQLTQRASLVAQMVKNLPAIQETWVRFLGWEDPLEKGMATHSSILTWRNPWTEEPGGLQSMELQRVRHNWATNTHIHTPGSASLQRLHFQQRQDSCQQLQQPTFSDLMLSFFSTFGISPKPNCRWLERGYMTTLWTVQWRLRGWNAVLGLA